MFKNVSPMDLKWLERTELLIKPEGIEKLQRAHVLVIGLGGVGSYAAEFLARAGVGRMTIVDGDIVDTTNRNRQLHAMASTVGLPKVALMAERLLDINPDLQLTSLQEFLLPDRIQSLITPEFNYVVECIDSITPKLNVILTTRRQKIPLISSMGAGGKLDPSKIRVTDISKSFSDPLARTVREYLRNRGVTKGVRVVFSSETPPDGSLRLTDGTNFKKSYYGTISYIPALFGLYAASEVVRKLLAKP